jgi:penicillin-binding protein 1C
MLSPPTTWLLAEMLTQTTRPDLPMSWKASDEIPQIAWKTGTSYGRRDAWSIGYNPRYTVVVWLGRFDGGPVPALSGAESATPLLFKIFRAIDRGTQQTWYSQPAGLETQWVCAETGRLPGEGCTQLITDYHQKGQRTKPKCDHLIQVRISPDSSQTYCRSCSPQNGYIEATYPQLTPELATWYRNNRTPIPTLPPHNPKCERVFQHAGPRITSPLEGMEYWIQVADSMKIALQCQVETDVAQVVWYIDDQYLGRTEAGKILFCTPTTGHHKITCTDDKGRKAERMIKVHNL